MFKSARQLDRCSKGAHASHAQTLGRSIDTTGDKAEDEKACPTVRTKLLWVNQVCSK